MDEIKDNATKLAQYIVDKWFANTTKEEQEKAFAHIRKIIPDTVEEKKESELRGIFNRFALKLGVAASLLKIDKSVDEAMLATIDLAKSKVDECETVSFLVPSGRLKRKLDEM